MLLTLARNAKTLLASPILQHVTDLTLHHCGVESAAVKALAANPHSNNIYTLDLVGNPGTTHGNLKVVAGLVALAGSPQLKNLHSVEVEDSDGLRESVLANWEEGKAVLPELREIISGSDIVRFDSNELQLRDSANPPPGTNPGGVGASPAAPKKKKKGK